jgi:hypothetical protein
MHGMRSLCVLYIIFNIIRIETGGVPAAPWFRGTVTHRRAARVIALLCNGRSDTWTRADVFSADRPQPHRPELSGFDVNVPGKQH